MESIIVIDDDPEIRKLIKDFLHKEGYNVETVKDGESAIAVIYKNPDKFSIAVLDIMLPDISGIEVCKEIRKFSNIPIIMLTARSDDIDKIVGLEVGADDYLTKPFNPKELVARIKAITRRAISLTDGITADQNKTGNEKIIINFYRELQKTGRNIKDKTKNEITELLIEPGSRKVFINNNEIKLTNKEYNILIYFINNKDIVISRKSLLENIWGYDFIGESRTIDVHVKELRKKLFDFNGSLIETIWSVGYRFNYDRELNSMEKNKNNENPG